MEAISQQTRNQLVRRLQQSVNEADLWRDINNLTDASEVQEYNATNKMIRYAVYYDYNLSRLALNIDYVLDTWGKPILEDWKYYDRGGKLLLHIKYYDFKYSATGQLTLRRRKKISG